MAERTNPHANLIIGAQDEATPVFEKIKASSQSMAAGVEQAAKQAAKGTQQLGDEAEKSHKKMQGMSDPANVRQGHQLHDPAGSAPEC